MKQNDLLLAVLVTFIWGVNFSVIKLGLMSLDPFILSAMRFLYNATFGITLSRASFLKYVCT